MKKITSKFLIGFLFMFLFMGGVFKTEAINKYIYSLDDSGGSGGGGDSPSTPVYSIDAPFKWVFNLSGKTFAPGETINIVSDVSLYQTDSLIYNLDNNGFWSAKGSHLYPILSEYYQPGSRGVTASYKPAIETSALATILTSKEAAVGSGTTPAFPTPSTRSGEGSNIFSLMGVGDQINTINTSQANVKSGPAYLGGSGSTCSYDPKGLITNFKCPSHTGVESSSYVLQDNLTATKSFVAPTEPGDYYLYVQTTGKYIVGDIRCPYIGKWTIEDHGNVNCSNGWGEYREEHSNNYRDGGLVETYLIPFTVIKITTPSGILSTPNCLIPEGKSSCSTPITWSTTDPVKGATSAVTTLVDGKNHTFVSKNVGTGNSGSASYEIHYAHPRKFYLYHNSVELAFSTATATCGFGFSGGAKVKLVWDGSVCSIPVVVVEAEKEPIVKIYAKDSNGQDLKIIKTGESAYISWDATNAKSCVCTYGSDNKGCTPSGVTAGVGIKANPSPLVLSETKTFNVKCTAGDETPPPTPPTPPTPPVTPPVKPTVNLTYESIPSDSSFTTYESRKLLIATVTNADSCEWEKKTQIIGGISGSATETVDIGMPGYLQYKSDGPSSYTTIVSSVAHYVTPTTTYSMTCTNSVGSTTGSVDIPWYSYQGFEYPYAGSYPTGGSPSMATVSSCVPGTSDCLGYANSYKFGSNGDTIPVYVSSPVGCLLEEINLSYLGMSCPSRGNIPYFPTCSGSMAKCRFYTPN